MWQQSRQLSARSYIRQRHSPIIALVVPPGVPTVDRAGPLLPALDTNITPCLVTTSLKISHTRLEEKKKGFTLCYLNYFYIIHNCFVFSFNVNILILIVHRHNKWFSVRREYMLTNFLKLLIITDNNRMSCQTPALDILKG